MSIFVDETVHEREYKGYTFGIKEIPYGKSSQINKKALKINLATNKPEIDLAVLQEEKILASLDYIKDPDGNTIAVTKEVVSKLKEDVAGKILEFSAELNEVSKEEKKN